MKLSGNWLLDPDYKEKVRDGKFTNDFKNYRKRNLYSLKKIGDLINKARQESSDTLLMAP